MRPLAATLLLCVFAFAPAAQDAAPQPDIEARLRKAVTAETDNVGQAFNDYKDCHDIRAEEPFTELLPKLASRLATTAADHGTAREKLDAGFRLSEDGFSNLARTLLSKAAIDMEEDGTAIRSVRGVRRVHAVVDRDYRRAAMLAGWVEYPRPPAIDDYLLYSHASAIAFEEAYNSLPQARRDAQLFPPSQAARLKTLEEAARQEGEAFDRLDRTDGFAKQARAAWLRFKHAQDTRRATMVRWNRAKNQFAFSQHALARESEEFDKVWTYVYDKPFILYAELPAGRDLNEEERADLYRQLALIKRTAGRFTEEFAQPLELARQHPTGWGKQAAEQSWPIAVVAFKDSETLRQFRVDAERERFEMVMEYQGQKVSSFFEYEPASVVPAYYSIRHKMAILSQGNAAGSDVAVADAAFRLMMDFHKPAGDRSGFRYDPARGGSRYSNLLIDTGLPLWVAAQLGNGPAYRLRPSLLAEWVDLHAQAKAGTVSLEELISTADTGDRVPVRTEWETVNLRNRSHPDELSVAAALYVHFFESFTRDGRHVYRAKWRELVRRDLAGMTPMRLERMQAFEAAFGLQTEDDWQRIHTEFKAFLASLQPRRGE